MSTHPNAILKLTVKAQGTTRALLRHLLMENRTEVPDTELPAMYKYNGEPVPNMRVSRSDDQLAISSAVYNTLVMETDYDEEWQISGDEGDLIVFKMVTYGYGHSIGWDQLSRLADELRAWYQRHSLLGEISVTANYW